MERIKVVFNWSGGKDSALALYLTLQDERYEVISLLTTVNKESQSSTMHGIPLSLLKEQAESIGIPLYIIDLKPQCGMEYYNQAMLEAVNHFKNLGVYHFAFGDIFLEDILEHRKGQLQPHEIQLIEPLWGMNPETVMRTFIHSGFKTRIVTVTHQDLKENFVGRVITQELVDSFPKSIDICGENGEFHTFCFDGPIFNFPIAHIISEQQESTFNFKTNDGVENKQTYWYVTLSDILL